MSTLLTACAEAGPLASLAPAKVQEIAQIFHAFYHTFICCHWILQDQNKYLESYHEFQQTWDECNDFLYHNPTLCHPDIKLEPTLLHRTAFYVYNGTDLSLLERRLELQLHIMKAKIDDILLDLYSTALRDSNASRVMINGGSPQYNSTLPSIQNSVDQNTWPLYTHLVQLAEAIKRIGAPPLDIAQREPLWELIMARFREHELPSQESQLMFSNDFQLSDEGRLRQYSEQTLKHRQSTYRQESLTSLTPTLRRRVYSHDKGPDLATFQWQPDGKGERLYTVDVVTKSGTRWIVSSTKKNGTWGIVQYLPSIDKIQPYTRHQHFNFREIRLFDPCTIDTTNGATTWRDEKHTPSYLFDSDSDAVAFQSALRGKILHHIFQVENIRSNRGFEGSAQPLKLWSDFKGRNRLLSFFHHNTKPFHHIDVPLRYLCLPGYITNDSNHTVRVEIFPPGMQRRPSIIDKVRKIFGSSPLQLDQGCANSEPTGEMSDTVVGDELSPRDSNDIAYLSIDFSTSDDSDSFQRMLREYFKNPTSTEIIIPKPSGYPTHVPPTPIPPTPIPPTPIPPTPIAPAKTKDLDYRVRGIKLEHMREDLLLFLSRKLCLESSITGRIKSLSISHTGESKVAVVSLKPRPECLSTPGQEEWTFGPTSEDDDTYITVDTHFRGVTVLYAPSQGKPHTLDICAVAGLGGHAWGSFKYKDASQASFMWILDALHKHFPTARIMTYGSKTKLDGNRSNQSLEELGTILRGELSVVRLESYHSGVSPAVRSYFIAHSLGGLTVKEALLQEREDPQDGSFISRLHGALFFGVPSHGMDIEVLRAMIRGQPNETLVESIKYQSSTLQELSRKFKAQFASGSPKIIYFYEMEASPSPKLENGQWRMSGNVMGVLVDRDSATDGYWWNAVRDNMQPLNRNHSNLVKFSSPNDDDFLRVLIELKKLIRRATDEEEQMSL